MQRQPKPAAHYAPSPGSRATSPGPAHRPVSTFPPRRTAPSTHRTVLDALVLDAPREPRARRLARLELGRVGCAAHGARDARAEVRERAQLGVVVRPAEEDEGPALVRGLVLRRGAAAKD